MRVDGKVLFALVALVAAACGGQTTSQPDGTGASGSGAVGGAVASGGGSTPGGAGGTTPGGAGGTTPGGAGGTSGAGAGGGGGSPGACPAWSASYGEYMLVLSLTLKPEAPLVFYASVSAAQAGPDATMSAIIQPLAWKDRKTPVGDSVKLGIPLSPDGSFDAALPSIDVPGDANPIPKGVPITIDISSFSGSFCAAGTTWCGKLNGTVTKPIPLELAGSTWTLSAAPFPEPPPIDCSGDLATPVDQL